MLIPSDERGFTLVELLVAVVLLGVVGGIVTTSIVQGMQSARSTTARVHALHEIEVATQRIGRELRAADPFELSPTGAFTTELSAQISRDGIDQLFTYSVEPLDEDADPDDTTLQLVQTSYRVDPDTDDIISGPTRTLVTVVANEEDPVFRYFGEDGIEIKCTDPADTIGCALELRDATQIGIRLVRGLSDGSNVSSETKIAVRSVRYRSR